MPSSFYCQKRSVLTSKSDQDISQSIRIKIIRLRRRSLSAKWLKDLNLYGELISLTASSPVRMTVIILIAIGKFLILSGISLSIMITQENSKKSHIGSFIFATPSKAIKVCVKIHKIQTNHLQTMHLVRSENL